MNRSYTLRTVIFEFILALLIIAGIVAAELMQIPVNEFLYSAGGMVLGFYFGKSGKTNGAFVAGKERGYKQALADAELGQNRLETVGHVTEVINTTNG